MTGREPSADREQPVALTAPLSVPVFRRIWLASLLTNFGLLILGVGAAWAMVQISARADMVALVQTALMLPLFLISVPAGALADMYDRRKLGLVALTIGCVGATLLSVLAFAGQLSPPALLFFCFIVGAGMALFGPAWQASVGEQVPPALLPQAVALYSISYNIARSFGPAIGGLVVATVGTGAAFVTNAVFFLPLIAVLLTWRREPVPSRLPPERIGRALHSGFRFIFHSPPVRTILCRAFALGLTGGSILGLMPMIAKDLLGGTAEIYGLVLGAFGIGSVLGGVAIGQFRNRISSEAVISLSALLLGLCVIAIGFSHWLALTMILLPGAGLLWTLSATLFNINIQLSAPRWVSGRALAAFQASIAGGIALGSWAWGMAAMHFGVSNTLLCSGIAIGATTLLRIWLRLPDAIGDLSEVGSSNDVDVGLRLTGRSGPIVIEVEYEIDPDEARDFYSAMQALQQVRHRNGAFDWSLARDIANPRQWTERFVCPTWHDYLRLRDRSTRDELAIFDRAQAYHKGGGPTVRRRLERPFGSVRWQSQSRDEGLHDVLPPTVGPT